MTLTTAEIKEMIEGIGVPYAYDSFEHDDETEIAPPFIIFYYGDTRPLAADNINYINITALYIELYTDDKDFELEAAIETALADHGLVYGKESTYISSEEMESTIYSMEVLLDAC